MIFLVQELGYAASNHQILQLFGVWERYWSLVAQTNGDIPQSFISRRTTFKEYLQNRLSDEYQFLRPLHRFLKGKPCWFLMHTRNMCWENFITKEQLRWRKTKGLLCQIMIQKTISSYTCSCCTKVQRGFDRNGRSCRSQY